MVLLERLLREAASRINEIDCLDTRSKGTVGDTVTTADIASERIICELLRRSYPSCKILTEETVSEVTRENFHEHQLLFVIDPLDGTTNRRFGLPMCAISVAAFNYGRPSKGGVLSLHDDVYYSVEPGRGVRIDGSVAVRLKTDRLIEALVAGSYAYGATPHAEMEALSRLVEKVASVRIMGGAVVDMVYTALGRFSCYVHNSLKPYDAAAALMMLKEMGLIVKNWRGEDFTIFDETIVAAPPELFDEFWEALQLA